MFELYQLRSFVAVAEHLHFGRAAQRLNMTQPPLSRQIQMLEREIGAALFNRTSRAVELTPAGRAFLPEARRILRLSESAMRWTQRIWHGDAGSLRIGFTAASGYHYIPQLLTKLRHALPSVDTVLREMVSGRQIEALLNEDIDIGFVRPPATQAGLVTLPVLTEDFMLAIARNAPLSRKEELAIADLDGADFVMYSPDGSRYFHDLLVAAFTEAGVTPRYVHQVGQIHSMLGLVEAGFGAALVPAAACDFQFGEVVLRPIDMGGDCVVRLLAAWRGGNENPVLKPFVDLCLAGHDTQESN